MRLTLPAAAYLICMATACHTENKKYKGWDTYKGSTENIQYSALTQIDTSNVTQLQVAWAYHTGDADTMHHSQIQCNPIIIDGVLYGTTPHMKLFAIDAATGQEKWQFDPLDSVGNNKQMFFILNNCRGVTYWSDGAKDKRIYYTAGSRLFCIQADSGRLVKGFGSEGSIDLHDDLGRDVKDLFITATSPPVVYKDLLITGSRVDEGAAAAPGHIRAYDVRTGQLRWIFHTIPQPGEAGHESWNDPDAWQFIGGANSWSGFSLDQQRGILFACTGSSSYDFYGGKRTGNNLFANCVLALDAATGKHLWHFQFVHHDIWDRDFSSPPALVTIQRNGQKIDAAAVTTKTGFVLLFDRVTGKPLFDIVERPVPHESGLAGEQLSPTQPIPVAPAPFTRQLFTEKDLNPLLPDSSYQDVKKKWEGYLHDHMYNPISKQGTIVFPGLDGGAEWGGPTFDPVTGILYINANEMAWVITAIDIKSSAAKETYELAGKRLYQRNCMSCHGVERKGSGNFPSLINVQTKYSTGAFDTLLQSGRRMMPAFKQLNDKERQAIASYILNIGSQKSRAFEDHSPVKDERLQLPYTITGYNRFLSKEGYPALSPPWGTLSALDLSTGQYIWKKTLGHDTAFAKSKEPTGTENYGASVVTAGGVLFIAATKDGKFRAFNKRNGQLLWETNLPAPGFATPAVYELNGKQYVVIACGGGKIGTTSGDSYVAFALPASGK